MRSYFSPLFVGFFWVLTICVLSGCGPSRPQRLQIGDPAPDFSVNAIDGRKVASTEQKGLPVVLRFFQPDCPYCRADTRAFNDYYRRYEKKGLKIVYIAEWQNDTDVREFVKKLKIVFPVVFDRDAKIAALYQVKVLPQTIVISPEGKIIAALVGGVTTEQLDEIVKPLL